MSDLKLKYYYIDAYCCTINCVRFKKMVQKQAIRQSRKYCFSRNENYRTKRKTMLIYK